MSEARDARAGWIVALVVALVCGVASWTVRVASEVRVAMGPDGAWGTMDPDSLYHARRLVRAWAGEAIERDPYLAYPSDLERGGAAVPWPPYYALLLLHLHPASWISASDGPWFAQDAMEIEATRLEVERHVASLPIVFSALTSALLALGAARAAGAAAGACAGLVHATTFGAVRYGALGNGDHHAFVSFAATLHFFAAGAALRVALDGRSRASVRVALAWGARPLLGPRGWRHFARGAWHAQALAAIAGALAGLLLGTWVASLAHVAVVELALVVAWALAPAERRGGVARAALVFHVAALAALAPALAGDPWLEERPLALVVLSWLQPALLACGALLALPWAWPGGARTRARAALSLVLLVVLAALALRPGSSVRAELAAAWEWAAAEGEFMRWVTESQPLRTAREIAKHLGGAVFVSPLAWCVALAACVRARRVELAPWLGAAAVFVPLALAQRRFAEAASVPIALLSGVLVARGLALARAAAPRSPRALASAAGVLVACALALASNAGVVRRAILALPKLGSIAETEARALHRARRGLCAWLAEHTPPPRDPPEQSVLASWDLGHLVEWAAARPTVASNFGTYLGRDSYLDPWRFFLALDERDAEAIVARRRARHVLLDSRALEDLEAMVRVLHPGERDAWLGAEEAPPRWLESVGARLLDFGGGPARARVEPSLGFLRLVHVAPDEHADPAAPGASGPVPAGWIYEHVPGAELVVHGEPGALATAALRLRYPGVAREHAWRAQGVIGADGAARLRIPYCTDAPNGDGEAVGLARWSAGGRTGEAEIPERAVLHGAPVPVP